MKININKILLLTFVLSIGFFQTGCSQRNFKKGNKEQNTDIKEDPSAKGETNEDALEEEISRQNTLISIDLEENSQPLVNEKIATTEDTKTTNGTTTTKPEGKDDVQKKEAEKRKGKELNDKNHGFVPAPLAKIFRVRLKIQNNNEHPMWYLMPYRGSSSLQSEGYFESDPSLNQETEMLAARRYMGSSDTSALIELLFTGKTGCHFRAFYIPPHSSFTLSNYVIDCWQDSDKVELWAVRDLFVNNEKSVAEWMPFSLLSSPNVVIRCDKDKGCQWEEIKYDDAIQADTNHKKIRFIQAHKINKYTVQLQVN